MKTKSLFTVLTLAAGLAGLAGCATQPGPLPPQDTTKYTLESTEKFVLMDEATQTSVTCTGLQERTLADGRLEVVANLRNSGGKPVKILVQCVFLDEQGLPVGPEARWRTQSINASSTEVVRFTAPVLAARKYSIRVRSAH